MPICKKPTQSSLCGSCRQTAGRAVSEAARAAYDRSSEKYLRLRRAVGCLQQRTKLGAHQNEWLTYATELRKTERSLEADLRRINHCVAQIQASKHQGKDGSFLPRYHKQDANVEGVKPVQSPALRVVENFSIASPLGECRDEERQPTKTKRCRLRPESPFTTAKSLSSGKCLLQLYESTKQTTSPVRRGQAPDEGASTDLEMTRLPHATTTLKYCLDGLEKKEPVTGVSVSRAVTTTRIPSISQQREDGNVLLKDVLTLRCYAKHIAKFVPPCPPVDTKLSRGNAKTTDADSSKRYQVGFPTASRHQTVLHDMVGLPGTDKLQSVSNFIHNDSQCWQIHSYIRHCWQPRQVSNVGLLSVSGPENDIRRVRQCIATVRTCTSTNKHHLLRKTALEPPMFKQHRMEAVLSDCPLSSYMDMARQGKLKRGTTGSGQLANVQEQEVCSPQHPPDQQECDLSTTQEAQRHAEEMPQPCVLTGCLNLPLDYQGSCFSETTVSASVTDFACLLQMQHAVLDHTKRKLQLEEACAEREVRNATTHFHQLICEKPAFATPSVRTSRSRMIAGQPAREADAWSDRCSMSRLSTRSELHVKSDIIQDSERTLYASNHCTDDEEELLQELTQAKQAYSGILLSAKGDEGDGGCSTEIMKLTNEYLGELEKLHADLENCLIVYTREADDLNVQQQGLLRKAHTGTSAGDFQDQTEVVDTLAGREPCCCKQACTAPLKTASTFTDHAEEEEEEFAHCRGCPAKSTLRKLFRDTDLRRLVPNRKPSPSLSSTRIHPPSYTVPLHHQGQLASAVLERVADASPTAGARTPTSCARGNLHGEKNVESNREPAFPPDLGQEWNLRTALLHYATKEFQHLKRADLQPTDCTLLDKLHFIFPKASQVTLRKLIDVQKRLLLLQQRRTAALWRFSRTRDEALTGTREQLGQLMLRSRQRREKQEQDAQQRKRTERLQKRLETQRRRAEDQQVAQSEAAEACAAAQNAREAHKNQREQQRRAHEKKLIAEHREAKAAVCKQQELETAAALQLEAAERAARRRRCRNLVLRRREEGLWKSRLQAQTRQYDELRQAQVIQRLLRLAEKYAVYVSADAGRVQQHTCASKAREQQIREEREAARDLQKQGNRLAKGCSPAYFAVPDGYNIENLLSDMRLRLSTALHEAGLSRSRAGREALLELQTKP